MKSLLRTAIEENQMRKQIVNGTMTTDQQTEWNYRYQERLGILMDSAAGEPSPAQKDIAREEANQAIAAIERQLSK